MKITGDHGKFSVPLNKWLESWKHHSRNALNAQQHAKLLITYYFVSR